MFYDLHTSPIGALNLFMTIIETKRNEKKKKELGKNTKFFYEINIPLLVVRSRFKILIAVEGNPSVVQI